MSRFSSLLLVLCLSLSLVSKASTDFISSYPQASMLEEKVLEFTEFPIVTGIKPRTNYYHELKTEIKVGHASAKVFALTKSIDQVRVFYNYKEKLTELGYEVTVATSTNTSSQQYNIPAYDLGIGVNAFMSDLYDNMHISKNKIATHSFTSKAARPLFFIAAKKISEESEIYFNFLSFNDSKKEANSNQYIIFTIEKAKITKDKIDTFKPKFLSAQDIKASIDKDGKAILNNILFDFDSAKIKTESNAAIAEIAKFMKENPSEKLIITGHTDNVGEFSYNVELSQKRAFAVMGVLIKKHGIDAKRFLGFGAGMAAPIASNTTDQGRARNRRVELVPWTQYRKPTPPPQKKLN